MLAIPINRQDATTLSDKYESVPYFALLDQETGAFNVVSNKLQDKSVEFLKSLGVDATITYSDKEDISQSLTNQEITLYTAKHQYLTIEEIFIKFEQNTLNKI